jgi:hypothetical protein
MKCTVLVSGVADEEDCRALTTAADRRRNSYSFKVSGERGPGTKQRSLLAADISASSAMNAGEDTVLVPQPPYRLTGVSCMPVVVSFLRPKGCTEPIEPVVDRR